MKSFEINGLRDIVLNNAFLYKIWFYTIRKHSGDYVRLPSIKDDFYFDGYPRSGNTYFQGLIEKIYPDRSFASHLHSISGLKIAIKLNLPAFVLIRTPQDAIISNLYKEVVTKDKVPNELVIDRLISLYINYYSFVKENINHIGILHFDQAVKQEYLVPKAIADIVGFDSRGVPFLKERVQDFHLFMRKKEAQKEAYASSLPNDERANFKSGYLNKIFNSSLFKDAKDIYTELVAFDLLSKNQKKI